MIRRLPGQDWNQIVGAISGLEGMVIYNASSRAPGTVNINLIDIRKERTDSGFPARESVLELNGC
ncbi:MAG: hypothetical protein ACREIA_06225 [Opitutaceae bacterium]